MQTEIIAAANALEGLATAIASSWTDQPYHAAMGNPWTVPPISRDDLAGRTRKLAERLKSLQENQLDPDLRRKLKNLPEQVAWFQGNALPNIGGNVLPFLASFESLMLNVEQSLPIERLPAWEEVQRSDLVPRELAKRIRSLEAALNRLEPRTGDLEEQIKRIDEAHAVALDLPTDLQTLTEARAEIERYVSEAKLAAEAAASDQNATALSKASIAKEEEAAKQSIQNIDAAYSAATTVGLAAAFTERAVSLTRSTWYWVGMLLLALLAGAYLGAHRLTELQSLAATTGVKPQWLWMNAGMSLLAIAAPVWFAWLATRQIGQRFRLSEDYAFKASVARAYEGYRREAARLDPELEARLFASALDRLDEAPLRFISTEEHGSPYEALLASAGFQKALEKFPDLRATVIGLAETAAQRGRGPVSDDARGATTP